MKRAFLPALLLILALAVYAYAMQSASYKFVVEYPNAGGGTGASSANYIIAVEALGDGIRGVSNSPGYTLDDRVIVTGARDNTPPTGSVVIDSDATYANTTSVTLTLTCSDNGSCDEMQFSNDFASWSSPESYSSSKAWTLSAGDGTKTVYAKFKDTAGNWSGAFTDTIELDDTDPTTSPSVTAGSYITGQSVVLSADEAATIYYTTDGTTPTTASAVFTNAIVLHENTTVKYFAEDSAGNSEAVQTSTYIIFMQSAGYELRPEYLNAGGGIGASSTNYIMSVEALGEGVRGLSNSAGYTEDNRVIAAGERDITPPTGSVVIDAGAAFANTTSVTLTLTCSDAGGCDEMQFSNDNSSWSSPESYSTLKAWTLSAGDGTKTVYAKLRDTAGNWSGAFTDTIELDDTDPTTSPSVTAGSYITGQSVVLSADEAATIYYTTDGTTPTTASSVYANPIELHENTTVKYFAVDSVGNSEAVKTSIYTIFMQSAGYMLRDEDLNSGGGTGGSASYSMILDAIGDEFSGGASSSAGYSEDSGLLEATDIQAPATLASPAGGSYSTAQSVTLTCSAGAGTGCDKTYYCLGAGCNPSTLYNGAINVSSSDDLRFYSTDLANNSESVKTESYIIDASAPTTTASPVGGAYGAAQSVTLSCDDGAGSGCDETYYCLGAACSPSTLYSGAINVGSSNDLRFYSADIAGNSEAVNTESYTISIPAPGPPTGITLSGMKTGGPLVSWSTVSNATTYNIYRSTDNSTWSQIGTVSHPTSSYRDSSAPYSNTKYWWTVTAENASGESTKPDGVAGRTALKFEWNMISAPYDTSGMKATQVFGSWANWSWEWVSSSNIDPDNSGVWVQNPTIEPGLSIWIWAYNDSTVLSASGAASSTEVVVTLVPGWNLISNQLTANMDTVDTLWIVDEGTGGEKSLRQAIIDGDIGGTLYWWDGTTHDSYTVVDDVGIGPVVAPWKGFWILNLDSVNHTLTIKQ